MRKHFLLLFLMALLPFAGFAADFSTAGSAVVDDIPYGQDVTLANVHFTLNGVDQTPAVGATAIYALENPFKYYTNADATTPLEGKPQCGTTYYIRIVPSDATNNGVTIAEVLFVKADLTVTVKSQNFFTKNFKDAKTALASTLTAKKEGASTPANADIVISGIVGTDAIADVLTWSNVDYSYDSENANCTSTGAWFQDDESEDIKTNKITFTGFTLTEAGKKNYNLKFTDTYMKIKQIPLTLGNYATSLANGKFTVTRDASYSATNKPKYTGVAQNLKYTVKWQYAAGTGKVYEMTDDDVVIKYKGASATVVDAIDADIYTPVLSFKKNGNFSGEDIEITSSDAIKYEINRRDLVVMLNPNSKTYDGYPFLSTNESATTVTPVYNFSTLMGKDAGMSVTEINVKPNDDTEGYLKKDVGFYAMIPVINNAKINYPAVNYTQAEADAYNTENNLSEGDDGFKTTTSIKTPASTVPLSKNYSPVPFPANWEIKAKKITVTATPNYAENATSITYGENIPNITISQTGALSAESGAVIACYKATTVTKENLLVGDNVITVALKEAADYISGTITTEEAAAEAKETAEAVLANYDIELKNGKLKVVGVGFTIAPNVAPTYEYGATITPAFVAVNTSVNPNVIVTTAKTPTFLYREATEDASAATETVPTAVGNYIVSIKQDAGLAPTIGYDGSKIVYNETPFSITKKVLDFTIGDVTLHNGDTEETLNQYGKITLKAGYALFGDEKLKVQFSFKAGVSPVEGSGMNLLYAENTGLSGTEGKSYMAIQASLPEGVADNDNYELKAGYTLGKLIIAEGRKLFVDGADANVNLLIKDAAAACANTTAVKYDVTFASRTLKANEWNVLVLPFAITPLDFCNAKCTVTLADNTTTKDFVNDYAVFNVLKSADMTKNSMKFGLTLNEIPANTPFLVKPTKDIEFMRTVGTGASQKKYYLTFTNRKVEYKEVPATTANGVNFIGTYKNQTVEGGAKIMYMGADDAGHYTFFTATDNGEAFDINLGSTRAYLDFTGTALGDACAPSILVEEADGSTTAIVGITADGVAVAAEGWYTINGIKLQGVPTEKGVYINNGKKVVVK